MVFGHVAFNGLLTSMEEDRLHSEILALINFNNIYNLVAWIEEQLYIEILFRLFLTIAKYIRVVGKM